MADDEAPGVGLHEPTFDASQLKEEGLFMKLPRTRRRIPYRDLDKTTRWQERFVVARRENLFWTSIRKQERFPLAQISVPAQSEPSVVFFRNALRQVLTLELHEGGGRTARLQITFMSRYAWHFWHAVFASGEAATKRGLFVKYRLGEGDWRRRYMRFDADHVAFLKFKMPVKVWPLFDTNVVLLPDRRTLELRQTHPRFADRYLYIRHASPERIHALGAHLEEQIARVQALKGAYPLLFKYLENPSHPRHLPIYVLNLLRDLEDNARYLARIPLPPFRRRERTFNILTIDGGGLRGLIPAIILERLCDRFPRLLDAFDMIAGTSSGAILAAALAVDHTPAALRTILEALSKRIFKGAGAIGRHVPALHAKFSNDILRLLCEGVWSDRRMIDIKRYLLVPYFSLDEWSIVAAHNLDPRNPTATQKVADVVMKSASAPSYFPAYQRCLDGATFAQHPAALAVVRVMTLLGVPSERIRVLSIGTGRWRTELKRESQRQEQLNWGLFRWLRDGKLPDIVLDGTVQLSSDITKNLLSEGAYHRLNPVLDKEIPLDSLAALPELERAASVMDLQPAIDWIAQRLAA